ncbi:MAG TPA: hypothetical protein VFN44_06010 [Solirubrobacteraceae bacterium]|nr:hypothetical protein [Solirubrobacteraceae bacterium]
MLLRKDTLERIAAGEVTVAFRWWTKPTVRAGGTLQTAVGQLAIASVRPLPVSAVTVEDAKKAGFASRAALLKAFPRKPGSRLYRVEFEVAGPDPRIALRERADLTDEEIAGLSAKLARMGPWARATLELIAVRPGTRAGDLAEELQQERLPFKANVRKLKALGLTESLEVGYRLSPRGRAYLDATRQPPTPV